MNTFVKNNNLLIGSLKEEFLYDPNKLVLVYDTSKEPENNTISVPLNGTINCTIDFGDGYSETYIGSPGWKTHTYANPGIYFVEITGTMTNLTFGPSAATLNNKLKLVRCLSFGNSVQTIFQCFTNCSNLIQCPLNIPFTATNLQDVFNGCLLFNDARVASWDVSNVTTIQSMFRNCQYFNVNLNSWNTSSITNMDSAFSSCFVFNQPLNNWNTENVVYMANMFSRTLQFNQPLNSWNVSKVSTMSSMFQFNNVFSQDLSSWDIRRVTNMILFFSNQSTWGTTNYSNSLINWAALPDVSLASSNITSITDAGNGRISVQVTAATDRFFVGQRVRISNTINYNGDYNVVSRPSNTRFIITKTFVGNESSGTAQLFRSRNVSLGVGNTNKYDSSAVAARNTLTNTYLWTITDGGMV